MKMIITCLRKKLLWSFVILCVTSNLYANNYYFSSVDGDDARSVGQAQNAATPWKSIDKLNTFFGQLNPGDNIFFKAGDVFYGTITVSKSGTAASPINFLSYGAGSKPQITGFTTISTWTNVGNSTWESIVPAAQQKIGSVLFNNSFKVTGRYPNADAASGGFLTIASAQGTNSITDPQIAGNPNWTGGEVVIRKARWVVDRNTITEHRGNTIFYTSQSGYPGSTGYGYFIQNHPAALDKDGEWYYQATNKKFGIFSSNGRPADGSVKVSTAQNLVYIDGFSGLSFTNLSFTGANGNAFFIDHSQDIQVKNCDILYSGTNAITAWNTTNLSVENNTIDYTNNIACSIQSCGNLLVKGNAISNSGANAGMGEGDSGSYEALLLSGDNQLIEGNTIRNTGYIPITFSGNNVVIKNNLIDNYAFVKDDGGGIYTWNNSSNPPTRTGQVVSGNIVLNGTGAGLGTPDPDKLYANGIYMDDNAGGVELNGNTVANCNGYGFYIHNAHDLVIKNNTVYNNTVQLEMVHDDIAPYPITNVSMTNNTFVSKLATQSVAEFRTNANDISNFGNFDNNYYSRPLLDYLQINVLFKENGNYKWGTYSVNGWKALYGKDQNSKASPFPIAAYKVNSTVGSNLFTNGSFDTNVGGLYAYSSANNASTTWNNGTLDGGALQVSFSSLAGGSNKASVIIGVGNISSAKNYILKFSLKGTNENKVMEAYLRRSGAPYSDITERKLLPVTGNRSEWEVLFSPTANEGNASIGLDIPEQSAATYIDNIQLIEANVTMTNPDDSIRFVYNASSASQPTTLDGNYADIAGTNYTATANIPAYGSTVFLKKSSGATPVEDVVCQATGTILREQWNNVNGNTVSDIPVQTAPSSTSQLTIFESPTDIADNYGARIRGYVCPPQTGNYTFWIASDDAAELWLSTDDNSANKVKIAYTLSWTNSREWNKYASQKSVSISLQAGHKYYIEALHKEGVGGDNLAVAWQLPNGTMEAPIAGSRLSPFVSTLANQTISFPALGTVVLGVAPFTITATASSGLPVSFRVVSGPATIAGSIVSIIGVGTVVIEASQAGNGNYNAAIPVTQSFIVNAAPVVVNCSGTGTILREQWNGIGGNDVSNIPVQTVPSSTSQLTLFESPTDFADNYGARVRGYLCPPQTGNYTFWIASDDASELWLSTDDNPSNKIKIAYTLNWTNSREWGKYASQKSVSIYLQAGYKYYIEALHKEGAGGDNLAVAWQLPSGTMEAPIPGNRLSPFIPVLTSQTVNFPELSSVVLGSLPFSLNATASSGLPVSFRVLSGPAIVIGRIVTVIGIGTVVIEASQTGNAIYSAATPVTQSFNVTLTPVVVSCSGTGTILREQWDNVSGSDISNVPMLTSPSSTSLLTSFEAPTNIADNYGARIRGYICPLQTGNYTFWIASDDASELWLSTDENPVNKVKIAYLLNWTNSREWNKYASQKSVSIYLQAGYKYYVEALHKEGDGGDNLAVAWQLPNGTMEAPIAGSRLSPFVVVVNSTCAGNGNILREQWNNVSGNDVINIPVQTAPSSTSQLTIFESPTDIADNYGARIRGYVCPPQTGNYTFWIASDDAAELWLSTDDNPINKTKIAYTLSWTNSREWNKYASQKSVSISLQAGRKYYIEALHKEGAGGDNLAVAWQLPNGTTEAPIPGSRLSPFVAASTFVSAFANQSTNEAIDLQISSPDTSFNAAKNIQISVHPNPVSTIATVDVTVTEAGKLQLDLIDQQGRVVKQLSNGSLVDKISTKKFTLDASGLRSGVYILRLVTQSGIISRKIVVAK